MTTPSNSPEEGTAPPPEPGAPAEHTDATAAAGPAEATPPPPPPPPAYPGPPPAYPFAPVARAPRMPWVNPARRGHVAAAALVGALVFGGGGLLLGHAVSDPGRHDQRRGDVVGVEPGDGMNKAGYGRGHHPHEVGRQQPNPGGPVQQRPSDAPSGGPTK